MDNDLSVYLKTQKEETSPKSAHPDKRTCCSWLCLYLLASELKSMLNKQKTQPIGTHNLKRMVQYKMGEKLTEVTSLAAHGLGIQAFARTGGVHACVVALVLHRSFAFLHPECARPLPPAPPRRWRSPSPALLRPARACARSKAGVGPSKREPHRGDASSMDPAHTCACASHRTLENSAWT
jgi:hypothetical protein